MAVSAMDRSKLEILVPSHFPADCEMESWGGELSGLELWLLKSPLSSADLRSIGDSFFASLAMRFIDYHFRITFAICHFSSIH